MKAGKYFNLLIKIMYVSRVSHRIFNFLLIKNGRGFKELCIHLENFQGFPKKLIFF